MDDNSQTPFRTSPAYEAHLAAGAAFNVNAQWRRVDYFRENETPELEQLRPQGDGATYWSTAAPQEHRAVRESAGLFDLSSFGKIEIAGPGAKQLLEWTCSNRVVRTPGAVTYTQMLNDRGGIEGDVTVAHLEEERFVAITNTGVLPHDLAWFRNEAANPDAGVSDPVVITDVTNAWAVFGVWGPRSREILAPLVSVSLENDAFPFLSTRSAEISGVPVRLCRVTFVGELGWEVYVPVGYGRWLWQLLSEAVKAVGGRRAGFHAIDSLRAEKGYLYLGDDIGPSNTPAESNLDRFVRKEGRFKGRSALEAEAASHERLFSIATEDETRPIQAGMQVTGPQGLTGTTTSGAPAYTVGGSIGFVYLPAGTPQDTELQVEVEGGAVPARIVAQPVYDPSFARVRA